MLTWQWFALGLLVLLLVLSVVVVAWIGRRWRESTRFGHRLASYLMPFALMAIPIVGRLMMRRMFELPGAPALLLRWLFSAVGYFGSAWLMALLMNRFGDIVVRFWFREARPLKKQFVRVLFRIATIVVVTGVTLRALQILGAPVTGLIAGLGVGGLAIALAAQGTLENFISGIILYTDRPVRVGDFCRFGDQRGTVEDVGLRSVKIRTVDRTLITMPNASFAKMQLENLTQRDRVLLREELCLRYETTVEQLQSILAELEAMLREHPRFADEPLRVRFTGFGRYYLEVELFAYALTSDWPEFLAIRQDVLMRVMEIIGRSGTRLALPSEVHYAASDTERPDADRPRPAPPAPPA